MNQTKYQSQYDLLRGRMTFTNEKPWLKIVIYMITVLFWLGCFWVLKEWVLPIFAAKGLAGIKLNGLLSLLNKGRAP